MPEGLCFLFNSPYTSFPFLTVSTLETKQKMAGADSHLTTHGETLLPGPFPISRHPRVACSPWLVATSPPLSGKPITPALPVSSRLLLSALRRSPVPSTRYSPSHTQVDTLFPFHFKTGCGCSILHTRVRNDRIKSKMLQAVKQRQLQLDEVWEGENRESGVERGDVC